MTPFNVIIPARLNSRRLPRKVLADIAGKPMIQHVYERASQSKAARVIIATDSEEIKTVSENFGAEVCLTAESHRNGTSRVSEAVETLGFSEDEIVLTVQGDEPLLLPEMLHELVGALVDNPDTSMSTLCMPFREWDEVVEPGNVKVVFDHQGRAMYFSRAPIPCLAPEKMTGKHPRALSVYYHHIGIYCQRVGFLKQYLSLLHCEIEEQEQLEQLRALWHGYDIQMMLWEGRPFWGVNTSEDLEKVRKMLD